MYANTLYDHASNKSSVVPPRGYLKKGVDAKSRIKESKQRTKKSILEHGPLNQEEIRRAVNLGFSAQVKRAEVIDQLGGSETEKPQTDKPTSSHQSVSKKAKLLNGRSAESGQKKKKPTTKKSKPSSLKIFW